MHDVSAAVTGDGSLHPLGRVVPARFRHGKVTVVPFIRDRCFGGDTSRLCLCPVSPSALPPCFRSAGLACGSVTAVFF